VGSREATSFATVNQPGARENEVRRCPLVGRETQASTRVGLVARRANAESVITGWCLLHCIPPLGPGQHIETNVRFRVRGLDKRAFKRRAVRNFHRARDRSEAGLGATPSIGTSYHQDCVSTIVP
jgi:hypothetical protein